MDKLKENAFGLALGGVALVFLGLAYVMIVGPVWGKGGLNAQEKSLATVDRKLKGFLKEKVLPTKAYNVRVEDQIVKDKAVYDKAVAAFGKSCENFQLFFEDATEMPSSSDFTAAYHDAVGELRSRYWKKFPNVPLAVPEDDRVDAEKVPPFFDTVKDADLSTTAAKIPFAMKQFWVTEAVTEACIDLEIDGLEKVDIVERREESVKKTPRSRGRSRTKESEKPAPYTVDYRLVEATVTVRMQYGLFEKFLARLLDRDLQRRVPFLEPKKIEMKALSESVAEFKESIRIVNYPNEGKAREAETANEPRIVEPKVEFKITLVAIDWTGVTRLADKTEEER